MENFAARFADSGVAFLIATALASLVLAALAYGFSRQKRSEPEDPERRRRLRVNRTGRLTSGMVIEVEESDEGFTPRLLHYTYEIGAVEYTACQNVESLLDMIGLDPRGLVGATSVKYQQSNPYNSIVVCEEWNGLRGGRIGGNDFGGKK